jgi:hypothetical protein
VESVESVESMAPMASVASVASSQSHVAYQSPVAQTEHTHQFDDASELVVFHDTPLHKLAQKMSLIVIVIFCICITSYVAFKQ